MRQPEIKNDTHPAGAGCVSFLAYFGSLPPVLFYQGSIDGVPTVTMPLLGTAPMVNGVSVFSGLSFKTAGTYTITAAVWQNGTAPSPPVRITVLPASARRVSIVSFQPAGFGSVHFEVELQDRFGNLASGDNSTLHFLLSPHVAGISAYVYPDTNTVVVNANTVRFVNGAADFFIDASGKQVPISVRLIDSSYKVPTIRSPIWDAILPD